MTNTRQFGMTFNDILLHEMRNEFQLQPLPLDNYFAHVENSDKTVSMDSTHLACPKTAGIRTGQLDLKDAMMIHFGNVPPAAEYDIPVLGYTFAFANKCLIVVLDLLPVSRQQAYMQQFIAPLEEIARKYNWIPRVEGGRSQVADWALKYDSGHSIYKWCDGQYMGDMENAFRDYVRYFCDCIKKADKLTDSDRLARRNEFIARYTREYIEKDVGGAPLKSHFGEEWGERYMADFFFAP